MEEGVNEVEEGVQRAAESGDTLKDILRQVETVSLEIGQIAVASEQQTASTDEIAQTIQKISGVMGATSEQIRDNSRAAAHLAALSKELHMLVAQFRV
jgi:methyl-accepting chemotaxis protein